jgi:hypothetical protein
MILIIFLFLVFILLYYKQFKEYFTNINTYDEYLIETNNLPQQTFLNFLEQSTNKKDLNTNKKNLKKHKCIENSLKICELSNPYSYISNSNYFPAPWLIKSYKNTDYPKNINMHCFNIVSNCCGNHNL